MCMSTNTGQAYLGQRTREVLLLAGWFCASCPPLVRRAKASSNMRSKSAKESLKKDARDMMTMRCQMC